MKFGQWQHAILISARFEKLISNSLSKLEFFGENRKFCEKLNFLAKIENFVKNWIFWRKSKLFSKIHFCRKLFLFILFYLGSKLCSTTWNAILGDIRRYYGVFRWSESVYFTSWRSHGVKSTGNLHSNLHSIRFHFWKL